KGVGLILFSYRASQGVGRSVSFPFGTFERAVLSCLREIDPEEIVSRNDQGADKVLALTGRLAEVEAEIEKVKNRLRTSYADAVAAVRDRKEAEKKALTEERALARQEDASPLSEAWGQCRSLIDVLEKAADAEEARVWLRAVVRRVVESVWVLTVPTEIRP